MSLRITDPDSVLQQPERDELLRFLHDDLWTKPLDLGWLRTIRVRDDGASGYSGYWTARLKRADGVVTSFGAVIVLNSALLPTVDDMKRALAHEYGHHWTLSYLIVSNRIANHMEDRLPRPYYRLRGLDPAHFAPDYSMGWEHCDKEVIAEDYRFFFGAPHSSNHRMVDAGTSAGLRNPEPAVQDYIKRLPSVLMTLSKSRTNLPLTRL